MFSRYNALNKIFNYSHPKLFRLKFRNAKKLLTILFFFHANRSESPGPITYVKQSCPWVYRGDPSYQTTHFVSDKDTGLAGAGFLWDPLLCLSPDEIRKAVKRFGDRRPVTTVISVGAAWHDNETQIDVFEQRLEDRLDFLMEVLPKVCRFPMEDSKRTYMTDFFNRIRNFKSMWKPLHS